MTNTTKRNDEHCPTNFVPEHYSFLEVLDLYAGTDKDDVAKLVVDTRVPREWALAAELVEHARKNYQALAIGERPSLAQCSICGHHIRYATVWEYRPEGSSQGIVTFGVDCAEKVGALGLTDLKDKVGAIVEFSRRMREMVRNAEAAHREAAPPSVPVEVADFLNDHARRHVDMPTDDCILCSFAFQLEEKGRLSERQVEVARDRAARAEALDPPVGEGITVVGRVRSCNREKRHALVDVGEQRVGLRRIAAHRVWLPVSRPVAPGTRVRFVAKLTASRDDPTFLIARDVSGQAIL